MPDNYITIADEKGSINISEDVIAVIASNALAEVDGIAAFSSTSGADLGELIGKKTAAKGVRVSFADDVVCVDLTVMVRFGVSITGVAEKAQRAVSAAVESMTGLRSSVNVRVTGVTFDKQNA